VEIVKLLLEKGSLPEQRIVCEAVRTERIAIAKLLVERYPNFEFLIHGLLQAQVRNNSDYHNLLVRTLAFGSKNQLVAALARNNQDLIRRLIVGLETGFNEAMLIAVDQDNVLAAELLQKKTGRIDHQLARLYDGRISNEMREVLRSVDGY
jgi:hypothetical protein